MQNNPRITKAITGKQIKKGHIIIRNGRYDLKVISKRGEKVLVKLEDETFDIVEYADDKSLLVSTQTEEGDK